MADQKAQPPAPKALGADAAAALAQECRKAMKGWGTDETKLIKCIAGLSNYQAAELVAAYSAVIKRDLIEDIKDECGGDFEDVLVSLLTPSGALIAREVRGAIKGLGTDEDRLIEALCPLSNWQLEDVKAHYKREFQSFLPEDVVDDCGGKLGKFFQAMLMQPRATPPDSQIEDDVLRLYKAGEDKFGTDSSVFIKIIGGYAPEYVLKVAEAYGKTHGKPLSKVVKDELSGDLERACLAYVKPAHEVLSERLLASMKGIGTNEKQLIRWTVTFRDALLKPAEAHFLKANEKSLKKWVESEVGGDFKKALVMIIDLAQ